MSSQPPTPSDSDQAPAPAENSESFRVRVDQLLSQEVRRQAKQDEATASRIETLRREIGKLRQELGIVRRMHERSESAITDTVDSRMTALTPALAAVTQAVQEIPSLLAPASAKLDAAAADQSALLNQAASQLSETAGRIREEVSGLLERNRTEIETRINAVEERLAGDLEVAQEALFEQGGQAAEAAAESARRMKFAIESGLGAAMANAIRPFSQEVRSLAQRISEAENRFMQSMAALQNLHRSLTAYLEERDAEMEQIRTRMLVQLLGEAGESLGGRHKAKLSKGLARAQAKRIEEGLAAGPPSRFDHPPVAEPPTAPVAEFAPGGGDIPPPASAKLDPEVALAGAGPENFDEPPAADDDIRSQSMQFWGEAPDEDEPVIVSSRDFEEDNGREEPVRAAALRTAGKPKAQKPNRSPSKKASSSKRR